MFKEKLAEQAVLGLVFLCRTNLINAYFMDAIRITCMNTHFQNSATLHLWNYLSMFSASPFCIILQEKVLVSQPKLEKMCTERLHFIMPGISFWFSAKASVDWIAMGNCDKHSD